MKKEKESRKSYQMGGVDKKGEQIFEIWKGGVGQKGGITIIKGGLVTPLETMIIYDNNMPGWKSSGLQLVNSLGN